MAGVNIAAVAAAAKDITSDLPPQPLRIKQEHVVFPGKGAIAESSSTGSSRPKTSGAKSSSAVVDGPPLSALFNERSKARARRASEGSRLARSERRRSNTGDLRCETCGKGYKHGSCLTKHLSVIDSLLATLPDRPIRV